MKTFSVDTPLLQNKRAVIFGAGGAIGQAVAKEFAAQGATVFLSGRTLGAIEQVAKEIHEDGGVASAAQVDAFDEQSVRAYLDRVAQEGESIDILLNAMGPQAKDYSNGTSTMELPLEQFLLPLSTMVPSQFITARSAARHMIRQHSGVILFVTAVPARGISLPDTFLCKRVMKEKRTYLGQGGEEENTRSSQQAEKQKLFGGRPQWMHLVGQPAIE